MPVVTVSEYGPASLFSHSPAQIPLVQNPRLLERVEPRWSGVCYSLLGNTMSDEEDHGVDLAQWLTERECRTVKSSLALSAKTVS